MTKNIDRFRMQIPPEIHNDLTRREFLAAAGLITLAPGCGSGGGGETTSADTRTIEHELGTTEVPVNVERVVTLNPSETDISIALGLVPVGASIRPGEGFDAYLGDMTEEIEIVGTYEEPNFEAIARLEPDVIVGAITNIEMLVDELSDIAPVIATAQRYQWKDKTLPLMGEALGRAEEAERLLADYERRVESLREAVGGRPEEITVSVIANFSGRISLELKGTPPGIILEDAGFPRPPIQDKLIVDGMEYVEVSYERISEIDADAIFFIVNDEELFEETQRLPIWQRLDAVQRGNVFRVDQYWWTAAPIAVREIIKDLEKHLVDIT